MKKIYLTALLTTSCLSAFAMEENNNNNHRITNTPIENQIFQNRCRQFDIYGSDLQGFTYQYEEAQKQGTLDLILGVCDRFHARGMTAAQCISQCVDIIEAQGIDGLNVVLNRCEQLGIPVGGFFLFNKYCNKAQANGTLERILNLCELLHISEDNIVSFFSIVHRIRDGNRNAFLNFITNNQLNFVEIYQISQVPQQDWAQALQGMRAGGHVQQIPQQAQHLHNQTAHDQETEGQISGSIKKLEKTYQNKKPVNFDAAVAYLDGKKRKLSTVEFLGNGDIKINEEPKKLLNDDDIKIINLYQEGISKLTDGERKAFTYSHESCHSCT